MESVPIEFGSGARVLVAGGSGGLGRNVVREVLARGCSVRVMARDLGRARALSPGGVELCRGDVLTGAGVADAVRGCDAVISTIGASLDPSPLRGWRGFTSYDLPGNTALIDASRANGVRRFVYVSTFHTDRTRATNYVRAHEGVVTRLRASGLSYGVLRPTGFYSAFDMLIRMALGGTLIDLGDGSARTNPIDDKDLAVACADALNGGDNEVALGGPTVYSRAQIAALIRDAVPKRPRLLRVPLGLVRFGSLFAWLIAPRTAHLMRFFAAVSSGDSVAPQVGTHDLAEYVRRRVAEMTSSAP